MTLMYSWLLLNLIDIDAVAVLLNACDLATCLTEATRVLASMVEDAGYEGEGKGRAPATGTPHPQIPKSGDLAGELGTSRTLSKQSNHGQIKEEQDW